MSYVAWYLKKSKLHRPAFQTNLHSNNTVYRGESQFFSLSHPPSLSLPEAREKGRFLLATSPSSSKPTDQPTNQGKRNKAMIVVVSILTTLFFISVLHRHLLCHCNSGNQISDGNDLPKPHRRHRRRRCGACRRIGEQDGHTGKEM